jgi:hypothetical protein
MNDPRTSYAALLLRIGLGAMFITHSLWLKLFVFTLPGTAQHAGDGQQRQQEDHHLLVLQGPFGEVERVVHGARAVRWRPDHFARAALQRAFARRLSDFD